MSTYTSNSPTARRSFYDWRLAKRPIQLRQVTPAMLAHVQADADRFKLPQTVWPSKWFGADFQGVDCLLTSAAAPGLDIERRRPVDAADGSGPFLTVLPSWWYVR